MNNTPRNLDDHDPEEWGNVQLPGLSDDKLLNTNWNYVTSNREKAKDPIIKQKQSLATSMLSKTDEYKNAFNSGMNKRNLSAEWKENMLIGTAKRSETDWKINQPKALREKLAKPILTPYGVFASITDAVNFELANGLSNANKKVYAWLKNTTSGYRYISKEEYIMLTGKEI
jgi:hypothetical protein